MKTVQDWGFISKDQGLVKPKLQDNKIFHALTTAYENNHQQEIYGATENIMRREKELCEMALADLTKLSGGKSDPDGTLKLVMEHYQGRLEMAREKEEKINRISEDSRKMMEEYKKRTQELAEVKRNLMESQSKLRDLAKTTEKLLKKEEELRFIETNLRTELDKNKRNIINGLYEIVTDISEQGGGVLPSAAIPDVELESPNPVTEPPLEIQPNPSQTIHMPRQQMEQLNQPRLFTEGLFRREEPQTGTDLSQLGPAMPPEGVWKRDASPASDTLPSSGPISPPSLNRAPIKEGSLLDKAARLRIFEPGKSLVSKSMVKTPDGDIISEYFYSPLHPREGRHYVFNSLFAVWSLLSLRERDAQAFEDRLETVFSDLLSRLEHSQNIHMESFLKEEINKDVLAKILAQPKDSRGEYFDTTAARILSRIDSIGAGRSGLIDIQFRQMPKTEYPPKAGLTA